MSAVISPCGQYRYRLDREVQAQGRVFAYFGINPSTANASLDDATVRKWRGFTQRNDGRKFIVGNVFSYRSADVRGLDRANRDHIQLQGPDHWSQIREIIGDADVLVVCWGNSGKVNHNIRPLINDLLTTLVASGKPVLHFGTTKSGDPLHPLMLGYDTPLTEWPV